MKETKNEIPSSEDFVLNTLSSNSFVLVNKKLLKGLKGKCNAAIILSELISIHKYYARKNGIQKDGSFPVPLKRFKVLFGISNAKQYSAVNYLMDEKLLNTYVRGYPSNRYVKLNFDNIAHLIAHTYFTTVSPKQKSDFYKELNKALKNDVSFNDINKYKNYRKHTDNLKNDIADLIYVLTDSFYYLIPVNFWDIIKWFSAEVILVKNWYNDILLKKFFYLDYNFLHCIKLFMHNQIQNNIFSRYYKTRIKDLSFLEILKSFLSYYGSRNSLIQHIDVDETISLKYFYRWEQDDKI